VKYKNLRRIKMKCEYFGCQKFARYQIIEYYTNCAGIAVDTFKIKVCADHTPEHPENDKTGLWDSMNRKEIKELK
jgi:hypothetical protein